MTAIRILAWRVLGLALLAPVLAGAQVRSRDRLLIWRLHAFTFQNREYLDPLIAERAQWTSSPGSWGVGLWRPVSFHMVEDLRDRSAPIVNTDYRFSFMLKAQRALQAQRYLALRLAAGHESTHLGDELSLGAQRRNVGFERVNVSYEYWDLAGSFEQRATHSVYRLRAGAITLLHPGRGYYSTDTAETNGRVVLGCTNSFEPYAGAEWIDRKAWRPPYFDFAPYVSLDARLKSLYD